MRPGRKRRTPLIEIVEFTPKGVKCNPPALPVELTDARRAVYIPPMGQRRITPGRVLRFVAAGGLLAVAHLGGCAPRETATVIQVKGNTSYVQGALAYQEGDADRAIAALQSALQENPDLIMARFLLGTIYKEKGEYGAAADQYKRVVELDPYVYSNHFNLGLMYHLLNQLQQAAASYMEALRLNPQDPRSNMYLALVHTALGRPDVALPYAQRAAELDQRSSEVFANLAVVLDANGDYRGGEQAYRRALELDAARPETIINLAGNLVAQKRYREALSVYEQALRSTESSLLRQRYGAALLAAGRAEDAIREFNRALELNQRNFQAINGLGDAMLSLYRQSAMLDEQKRVKAVEYWKRSLELNAQQPRVAALVREYEGAGLFK